MNRMAELRVRRWQRSVTHMVIRATFCPSTSKARRVSTMRMMVLKRQITPAQKQNVTKIWTVRSNAINARDSQRDSSSRHIDQSKYNGLSVSLRYPYHLRSNCWTQVPQCRQ